MAKEEFSNMNSYAKRFGRPDIERIGFFIDMPRLPQKPGKSKKAAEEERERSMLAGYPKTKCGNMDGYFDTEFRRIGKGEGPGRPPNLIGKIRKDAGLLPFMPPAKAKVHATPGDYYGCFHEHKAFSPKLKARPKYEPPRPNFVTNPAKKGGPGYINITIAKYPYYKGGRPRKEKPPEKPRAGPIVTVHFPQPYFEPNPYRDPLCDPPKKRLYIKPKEKKLDRALAGIFMPTGPAKWLGGCKGGTFEKFPEWQKDRWLSPYDRKKALYGKPKPLLKGEFYPQSYGYKTKYTNSVLYNTDYSMNGMNWKTYEPTYVKRLLKNVY